MLELGTGITVREHPVALGVDAVESLLGLRLHGNHGAAAVTACSSAPCEHCAVAPHGGHDMVSVAVVAIVVVSVVVLFDVLLMIVVIVVVSVVVWLIVLLMIVVSVAAMLVVVAVGLITVAIVVAS